MFDKARRHTSQRLAVVKYDDYATRTFETELRARSSTVADVHRKSALCRFPFKSANPYKATLWLKAKKACKDENYLGKPCEYNEILLCRMKSE